MTQPKQDDIRRQVHQLLEQHVEAGLQTSQRAQLNDLLRQSAVARQAYRAFFYLHGAIQWDTADRHAVPEIETGRIEETPSVTTSAMTVEQALPQITPAPLDVAPRSRQYWRRHPVYFWTVVSALTLMLGAGFFLIWSGPFAGVDEVVGPPDTPGAPAPRDIVAALTRTGEPVWGAGSEDFAVGHSLAPGDRLWLESGLAEVTFAGGAVVLLEGPAEFRVDARAAGRLKIGKLTARAHHGFSIATPGAKFIDLGTTFGASVDKHGVAELHVFEGKVRAEMVDATGRVVKAVTLIDDEAARIDSRRARIATIAVQPDKFAHAGPVALAPLEVHGALLDLSKAPAVASSVFHSDESGFGAANAFDGNPASRWVSELGAAPLPHWIYVDLGEDLRLKSVVIDFQKESRYIPGKYQLLMRTEAQGTDRDPASWTEVAAHTNRGVETTAAGVADHHFDFSTKTFSSVTPTFETGSFSGASPVGRYLMISVIDLADDTVEVNAQAGISIWEVRVAAERVTPAAGDSPDAAAQQLDEPDGNDNPRGRNTTAR